MCPQTLPKDARASRPWCRPRAGVADGFGVPGLLFRGRNGLRSGASERTRETVKSDLSCYTRRPAFVAICFVLLFCFSVVVVALFADTGTFCEVAFHCISDCKFRSASFCSFDAVFYLS